MKPQAVAIHLQKMLPQIWPEAEIAINATDPRVKSHVSAIEVKKVEESCGEIVKRLQSLFSPNMIESNGGNAENGMIFTVGKGQNESRLCLKVNEKNEQFSIAIITPPEIIKNPTIKAPVVHLYEDKEDKEDNEESDAA